jgi:hypothetical protein
MSTTSKHFHLIPEHLFVDAEDRDTVNKALVEANADGFRDGVGMAQKAVRKEVEKARFVTSMACWQQARQRAEDAASEYENQGKMEISLAISKVAQFFGEALSDAEEARHKAGL